MCVRECQQASESDRVNSFIALIHFTVDEQLLTVLKEKPGFAYFLFSRLVLFFTSMYYLAGCKVIMERLL